MADNKNLPPSGEGDPREESGAPVGDRSIPLSPASNAGSTPESTSASTPVATPATTPPATPIPPVSDGPPAGACPGCGGGKLGKGLFLLAALLIVGWMLHGQFATPEVAGWRTDLSASLELAAREGRSVVALVFDSPQNHDYQRMLEVVEKSENIDAMDKRQLIRVQARIGLDDPLARRYGLSDLPATLLIGPDGELVTAWQGYIGEVDFRARFLAGEAQH